VFPVVDDKGEVVLCGEGRAAGLERKMNEVRREVTRRLQERPGLLRSRMYHSAGLTRARVRVSWRVDCQGRRRYIHIRMGIVGV
jgi:hypothetical protein